MIDENIQQIELSLEAAKEKVELMEAVDRLYQNKDFQKVFVTDYFRDEPARLVELRSSPQMALPERQDSLLRAMDAIGYLQLHLSSIQKLGDMAKNEVEAGAEAIAELEGMGVES